MISKNAIKNINEYFQRAENFIPSVEEIATFEEYSLKLNRSILEEDHANCIFENGEELKISKTKYDISDFDQYDEKLKSYRGSIEKLNRQISVLDEKCVEISIEKEMLQEAMKEYANDRDIILALKCGTLSHFCYDKKIKFGFLLNKKTMEYKTFPHNLDENLPEEMECRWAVLRSFITRSNQS